MSEKGSTSQGQHGFKPGTGTGWTAGSLVPHHRTGPDQDQAARLAVVRGMSGRYTNAEMAEVLDMLALRPGQEQQRRTSGPPVPGRTLPGEGTCGPKTKMSKVYVPN